jgi:hypothetical protein
MNTPLDRITIDPRVCSEEGGTRLRRIARAAALDRAFRMMRSKRFELCLCFAERKVSAHASAAALPFAAKRGRMDFACA